MPELTNAGLTYPQTRLFAAGLYHVATLDGVHEREVAIVREFLRDAGVPELEDKLPSLAFDLDEALEVLDTSFARRLFLKACLLVVHADHEVTPAERELLDFLADAFGLQDELAALEGEVAGVALE